MTALELAELMKMCEGAQVLAICRLLQYNYNGDLPLLKRVFDAPTDCAEDVARSIRNYLLLRKY